MATITAVKSGNWSDTTVWDLGRAPLDGDTVLAVGYTIEFNADVTQPNTVLNATSGNFRYSGTSVRNVTANANVGTHSVGGLIQNNSTGTLNFSGAILGGSGSYAHGANNTAAGTLTVTTATGGSGSYAYGAFNTAAGTLTVTTATGGSGSQAHGAFNNAAGTLTFGTAVGNDWGPGGTHSYASYGVYGVNTVGCVTRGKAICFGAHGMTPIGGAVQIVADAALNRAQFATNYSGGTLTLLDATATADWPATANVRSGIAYDNGNKTGTCAVPAATNVAYGVPVDATTGTAVLTAAAVTAAVWDAARAGHTTDGTFGDVAEWAGNVDAGAIATATAAAILATPANKLATDASGGVALAAAYDAAKTAAQAGDAMTLVSGAITATVIATDAIDADALKADAIAELATAVSGVTATVAISAAQAASVSTGTLAIRTYHSLSQAITSTATAAMNTATKIWLAVKIDAGDADAESILFIEAAAGLSVLAGAAYATPAHGSLTLSGNAGAWSLAVVLDKAAAAQLGAFVGGSWPAEVKALVGSDTVAYWDGRCDISAGIVRLYA